MKKGYFLSAHRSEAKKEKRTAYIELAVPAIKKHGGTILASTNKIEVYENGRMEQTVLIEFESFEKVKKFYHSKDYQDALKALDGGADRDIRLFEGI